MSCLFVFLLSWCTTSKIKKPQTHLDWFLINCSILANQKGLLRTLLRTPSPKSSKIFPKNFVHDYINWLVKFPDQIIYDSRDIIFKNVFYFV